MLDAQPAANAPARLPAVQPLPASPANADTTGVRSKPAALLAAATALLPNLEAGRTLDAKTLREAMSAAFGANDTQGAWVWKDAYEAAEAAMVLFIQRYGRLMRREAGAGPGSAAAMLAMLETLAALEPSQTRRSEEQLALQQFSTPLPLAYAALQAAAIRPGDTVLEPSAGTGMLAVMAECALGKHASGARSGTPLHLNEIATVRAGLLAGLFERAPVTRHNAESIADYLPDLRPTVVLMNPPFSASPGVQRIRHDAGSASPPFRLFHASGGRAAGGDHVGRLHPGRCRLEPRLRASRSAAAHRLFHRHRRARLRTARHDLRYQAHRDRPRYRERSGRSDRRTGIRPHRCPGCLQPSPPMCRSGRRSCQYPRPLFRPAICSAMPPHGRPHESGRWPPRPRQNLPRRRSTTGGR